MAFKSEKARLAAFALLLFLLMVAYYGYGLRSAYAFAAAVALCNPLIAYVLLPYRERYDAKFRALFTMAIFLLCFSFTAISLSMGVDKFLTPENIRDPYATTKRLLVGSYYDGTRKNSEDYVIFGQGMTLSSEEIVYNTTIPVWEVEIICKGQGSLTCAHNAAHAWNLTRANVAVQCHTLPCQIAFEEITDG